jgi:hypothetical protein
MTRASNRGPSRFPSAVYVGNNPVSLRDVNGLWCIGGGAGAGPWIGGKLCIDGKGISACVEIGVGAGTEVNFEPLAESEITHSYAEADAGAKAEAFGLEAGVGIKAKGVVDKYGCSRAEIGLTADLGPGNAEARIYDSDKGWLPGKGGVKGSAKPKVGGGGVGARASAKAVIGGCIGSRK